MHIKKKCWKLANASSNQNNKKSFPPYKESSIYRLNPGWAGGMGHLSLFNQKSATFVKAGLVPQILANDVDLNPKIVKVKPIIVFV